MVANSSNAAEIKRRESATGLRRTLAGPIDAQLQSELLGKLAHDVRTPLAVILALAASKEAPAFADKVRQSAQSILEHMDDLGLYARLLGGRLTLSRVHVDLAATVRAVAPDKTQMVHERGVALRIDAEAPALVTGDPAVLRRIVTWLIGEAFRRVSSGATLSCAVTDEKDVVTLRVMARRLEGDEASEGPEDQTLGMSMLEPLVRLHGGEVAVQRRDGRVFEMRVELPNAPAANDALGPPPPSATLPPADAAPPLEAVITNAVGARPRVLVVEDDPSMNHFLSATLRAEYDVETAWNGADALERVVARMPDLILTDLRMPLGGGDRLVRELRAHREYDNVPIVVLTADTSDALCVELLRAGAQDHLRKPCTVEELRLRVGNLVAIARSRAMLQSALVTQQTDLEGLVCELAARTREIQRVSAVKSDFLRLASHELRTPLTALKLQLEFLRKQAGDLGTTGADLLKKALASAGRLQDLLESLLEYTRIESGKVVVEVEPVDLVALCSAAVDELRAHALIKGLSLSFVPPDSPPSHVTTDEKLLRLVLVNLVGNAVKFTAEGSVDVTCGEMDGEHWIRVHDTGPGISEEARATIFEPFVQLERLDRKHLPGVGLGLSLVKQLVAALDGRVELTSVPGKGATFTVHLGGNTRADEALPFVHDARNA